MIIKVTLVLIFICFGRLFSQEMVFQNIGVGLGIPSSEMYNVFQDSKNYIWFSTEAGLCRYNGNEITIYDEKSGLSEKACYGICECKGELWFITSKNRVLSYDEVNNRFVEADFYPNLKKQLDKIPTSQLYSIQKFDDNNLWINSQWLSFKVNVVTNSVTIVKPSDDGKYYFVWGKYDVFPLKIESPKFINKFNGNEINLSLIKKDTIKLKVAWNNPQIPQWRCLSVKNRRNEVFIGWDNYLFKVDPSGNFQSLKIKGNILKLTISDDNDLWIGTSQNGVLYFPNSDLKNSFSALVGLSVSGIIKDHEGGIWCSTIEKGLFYCYNENLIHCSDPEGNWIRQNLFKAIDNKVFTTNSKNELVEITDSRISSPKYFNIGGQLIRDIEKYKRGYLIIGYNSIQYVDRNLRNPVVYKGQVNNNIFGGHDVEITDDNRIYFIQNGSLFEISDNRQIVERISRLPKSATVLKSCGNSVYLGTKEGLFLINTNNFTWEEIKGVKGYITGIIKLKSGQFAVITKDNGYFLGKGNYYYSYTKKLHLEGIRLFCIAQDQSGVCWIASNKGLIRIRNMEAVIFNRYDGLPSDEVFKVACSKGCIYLSTNEGIYIWKSNQINTSGIPPYIFLKSILVNGHPTKNRIQDKNLNYYQNNLKLTFDVLTYRELGKTRLQVKISGEIDTVFTINRNYFELSNLSPGQYKLEVIGMDVDNVSSNPISIVFQIEPPFWKLPIVIFLSVVFVVGSIFLVVYAVIKRIQRKEREKTRLNRLIAEYQLTAMQSQMKPHFIFNAINSIQTFVLENDTQPAYDYLAKFAKLIRMVLNSSKNKLQNLDKELELLMLYIELEQLRFENRFEFELIIDENLELTEIEMPPLLIQPFVENAIWHGLMPLEKQYQGKLKIEIHENGNSLLISVEDNGIGRERSMQSKRHVEHDSLGMELSTNRIEILNSIVTDFEILINVLDLKDKNGKAQGTRVEIVIKDRL